MADLKLQDDIVDAGARFSPCERYRYSLHRTWNRRLPGVAFVGINPSTASATADDNTIRKCITLARLWGFGTFRMLNLFAWRSTDPDGLLGLEDPIGPDNDRWIIDGCQGTQRVVMAWGRFHKQRHLVGPRAFVVRRLLSDYAFELGHLGLNGDGSPKHPLYLKGTTPFAPAEATP